MVVDARNLDLTPTTSVERRPREPVGVGHVDLRPVRRTDLPDVPCITPLASRTVPPQITGAGPLAEIQVEEYLVAVLGHFLAEDDFLVNVRAPQEHCSRW